VAEPEGLQPNSSAEFIYQLSESLSQIYLDFLNPRLFRNYLPIGKIVFCEIQYLKLMQTKQALYAIHPVKLDWTSNYEIEIQPLLYIPSVEMKSSLTELSVSQLNQDAPTLLILLEVLTANGLHLVHLTFGKGRDTISWIRYF
jgi:hypothetical protein